jgi:hypothetical protein
MFMLKYIAPDGLGNYLNALTFMTGPTLQPFITSFYLQWYHLYCVGYPFSLPFGCDVVTLLSGTTVVKQFILNLLQRKF